MFRERSSRAVVPLSGQWSNPEVLDVTGQCVLLDLPSIEFCCLMESAGRVGFVLAPSGQALKWQTCGVMDKLSVHFKMCLKSCPHWMLRQTA